VEGELLGQSPAQIIVVVDQEKGFALRHEREHAPLRPPAPRAVLAPGAATPLETAS